MNVPYSQETMRRAQLQAAAKAQMARILRAFSTDLQRLEAGDRAYDKGDILVASRIFVRVAGSRPPNPITLQARHRLNKLAQEARDKLEEIDSTFAAAASTPDDPDYAMFAGPIPASRVVQAFQAYDEIVSTCASVPAVKREIAAHVTRQRRKPEDAAVLKEPQAKRRSPR